MNLDDISLDWITGTDNNAERVIPSDVLKYYGNVGGQIRDARQAKNLNQDDFARMAGISKVQLSRIENNKHTPSRQTLKKISALIEVPYPDLALQAGYNNREDDAFLFTKNGEALDAMSIASSIYRSDSGMLAELRNFEEIGTSTNVTALKCMLSGMRREVMIEAKGKNAMDEADRAFMTSFSALKSFIISTLSSTANEA